MNDYFSIIYKTQKVFARLQQKEEEDLNATINILLILTGISFATESYFKERIVDFGLLISILSFLFICGIVLLTSKFLISYLLWGIGKLLKGESRIIEIQTAVAFSFIPRILILPIYLYVGLFSDFKALMGLEKYLITTLFIIVDVLTYKILISGLVKFNNYGFVKAIINLSPLILTSLAIIVYGILN